MNKRYLWVASALLVLAGCAKSFEPAVEPEPAANTKAKDPWVLQDLSSQMKQGPAEKHVLQADFAGTRSTVAMNEAGTSASSVWSAGDSFDMYALDASTQDLYYSTFTTVNGGADAHFTTDSGIPESLPKPYDVLYPGIEKYGFAGEELVYGLTLPTEQPAVPGGIADGLALSYTTAENLTDAVHFKSLVSIVRFRATPSAGPTGKAPSKSCRTSASAATFIPAPSRSRAISSPDRTISSSCSPVRSPASR